MKPRGIAEAFPIVASALGHRFGVAVEFGGDEAMTDGQRIVLPELDLDTDAKDAAWGFLCHECSHVRFTDWNAWKRATSSPLRAQFTNAAEDIRIEQLIAREYPGTKRMLDDALDHVMDSGFLQPPRSDESLPSLVFTYVLSQMRSEHLDQERLAETARVAGESLEAHLSHGVRTRLDVLLQQGGTLSSTADAVSLADRLIKVLEEAEREARERADQQEASQGSQSGDSQAGTSSGSDSGQADTAGDSQSQDQAQAGDDGGDQAGVGEGSSAGQSGQSGDGTSSGASSSGADGAGSGSQDRQLSEALQSVLQASQDDLGNDLGSQLAETLKQSSVREQKSHSSSVIAPSSMVERGASRPRPTGALENSRQLQARLKGLVQASQRRRPLTGRRGKRIDGARMWRVGVGDPRILRRETERRAPNAAVHLLVDQSSSMKSQDPQSLAMASAIALSAALYEIKGVNPAVSAFPHVGNNGMCGQLVQHGQSPRARVDRFWHRPDGNTPMAAAMLSCLFPLLQQREERKLLVVITDGKPNGSGGPGGVAEINRRCQSGGVEVYGIGIGVNLAHLFPVWTSINDVGELRQKLFDLAQQSLISAA